MIKQVIDISTRPARLRLSRRQMVVELPEQESRQFPCEDVGVLLLQNPGVTISGELLGELLGSGATVVVCGRDHLPVGQLLPTVTHTEVAARLRLQAGMKESVRNRLWAQLVRAKILAQAEDLEGPVRLRLERMAKRVRVGDPENLEAQAARSYWSARFPVQYEAGDRRKPDGDGFLNAALNYGYAVLRAAVARSIVCSGLQPGLGVHHRRRDNPFCLADDLMEPFRPMVDRRVSMILRNTPEREALQQDDRRLLLEVLNDQVVTAGKAGPLMVALSRLTASFCDVLAGEGRELSIPVETE